MPTKVETEFKPCPFTHSARQLERANAAPYASDAFSEDRTWCVYCPTCSATGGFYNTREQAEAAWNARTFPSEEYICKCGIRVTPHRCGTETEF